MKGRDGRRKEGSKLIYIHRMRQKNLMVVKMK
jgi:hypothetical protein